jgi:hypothetical protein
MNNPKKFLSTLRKMLGNNLKIHVFVAVPNAMKAFEKGDFTDTIYEHVSYFTVPSLVHLFSSCGFDISEITASENEIFDSIYVDATSKIGTESVFDPSIKQKSREIRNYLSLFASKSTNAIEKYRSNVSQLLDEGKRVVVWGAGARGVTLLNVLRDPRIEYAVDLNPRKQGKYVPGTGQKIVPPEFLLDDTPDYIILANPAYKDEISHIVGGLGITPDFILI